MSLLHRAYSANNIESGEQSGYNRDIRESPRILSESEATTKPPSNRLSDEMGLETLLS